MALFTDGTVSSIEDLSGQDAQVLEVASLEGIDLTRKLALAREEIAIELATLLPRTGDAQWLWGGIDPGAVVVTPALKLWHVYRTLEAVYRDAYSSQLNDRYAARRNQYRELARRAFERLMEAGVGMANYPMPQAPAPSLKQVTGTLADGTYYVAASWVNKNGAEGAASVPAEITVASATFEATLTAAPGGAAGWHVYAGTRPDALVRQNSGVVAAGATWTQAAALATEGAQPGTGQEPDLVRAVPRTIMRG